MAGSSQPPAHEDLVVELAALRSAGLTKLRGLDLPDLSAVAEQVVGRRDPNAVEHVLRRAVERLGGGELGTAASYLFGLEPGTRGRSPTELRRLAAEYGYGMSAETFRKLRQPTVFAQIAEQLLGVWEDTGLREAHSQMERREPAESRLAVQWVERFEAYYRIWTPIYALAADLTAYRSTLLDEDRPWDLDEPGRVIDPMTLETEPYSQEYQAQGYVRFGIFRYADYLWQLHSFQLRHGGFWLLSDAEVEQQLADAIYRIGWHSPNNERDDSWMRTVMREAHGEMHTFLHLLKTTTIGVATHDEWQQWAAQCQCRWAPGRTPEERGSDFAAAPTDEGVEEGCQVHQVVEACSDYCKLIDQDWMRIADWYRLEPREVKGRVTGEGLYGGWRRTAR